MTKYRTLFETKEVTVREQYEFPNGYSVSVVNLFPRIDDRKKVYSVEIYKMKNNAKTVVQNRYGISEKQKDKMLQEVEGYENVQ